MEDIDLSSQFETFSDSSNCPNQEKWFHATLAREESDRILQAYHPGSYLVRKSDKSDNYRLSVVGNDQVGLRACPKKIKFYNSGNVKIMRLFLVDNSHNIPRNIDFSLFY